MKFEKPGHNQTLIISNTVNNFYLLVLVAMFDNLYQTLLFGSNIQHSLEQLFNILQQASITFINFAAIVVYLRKAESGRNKFSCACYTGVHHAESTDLIFKEYIMLDMLGREIDFGWAVM